MREVAMKVTSVRLGLLLLGLRMLTVQAATEPHIDPFVRHTTPVADHVWLIFNSLTSTQPPFEGNVVVFEQSGGLVVVDAGGCPRSGQNAVAQIRSISRKPVRYLVCTHPVQHDRRAHEVRRRVRSCIRRYGQAGARASQTGGPIAFRTAWLAT